MEPITSLPSANTIDPVNDTFPIVTNTINTTQQINRNTFLGLGSAPVGLTDTQTLTNKTITSPTISGPTFSGTLIGTYTIGGTPTFPSSVVQLTTTQTLTNKTLTSPTINSPTITNATLSADTITGFTNSTNGTLYGMSITSSIFTSAVVGPSSIVTNAVQASNLSASAITLGYAQITTTFQTTSTSFVQVTGLSATVTIPSGGRKIKITVFVPGLYNSTATSNTKMSIWDGTVGSGTQLTYGYGLENGAASSVGLAIAVVTPSAGSKTYNVGLLAGANQATMECSSVGPAFILVEAI